MKLWDITDEIFPGVQITEVPAQKRRVRGMVSSAIKVAFSVGMVIASQGAFRITAQNSATNLIAKVYVTTARPLNDTVGGRVAGRGTETDTQRGQSTAKLSNAWSAYFQPITDEEPYEDDYSFS